MAKKTGVTALGLTRDAWQSPACRPPGANVPAKLWLLDKVHQIFTSRRDLICRINARLFVAILPSVVECQRTE